MNDGQATKAGGGNRQRVDLDAPSKESTFGAARLPALTPGRKWVILRRFGGDGGLTVRWVAGAPSGRWRPRVRVVGIACDHGGLTP